MKTSSEFENLDTSHGNNLFDQLNTPIAILDTTYQIRESNQVFRELFDSRNNNPNFILSLFSITEPIELTEQIDKNDTAHEIAINDQFFVPHFTRLYDGWIIELQNVTYYKRLNHNQSESMRYVLHDLRSPLTAIQGFASMMDSVGELNEKQKYFISKILSGITQMTALVENVQDAGRYDPDSGSYQVMRSPTDLGQIARKIADNHLVPAEKNLSVNLHIDEKLPIINADETMLQRAITNLVDNAIKYTPDGGSINISAFMRDNSIIVSVQDTGLGISPSNQAQLFERHSRIHRPEFKKIKGTGLGLFIVRSVARRHGGNAWVESEEGKGSTFFISIPLISANIFSATD